MSVQAAKNTNLMDIEKDAKCAKYDEKLHERFVRWKDQCCKSISGIAEMLGHSRTAVSQYINKVYAGNINELEKDIANLLKRTEDLDFTVKSRVFCATKPAILVWEVLQYCDKKLKMGVALAPSGTGKSETCKEYKRQNRQTILITADITTRTPGTIIHLIADKTGGRPRKKSISDLLHTIIVRLKGSQRLIIIDDAHFLNWETFELVRKIHDYAGVGVVYTGQERLYEQMKGNTITASLYDQIYSRIAIKRDSFVITKNDVKMITSSVYPYLDRDCIDYLFKKARGKGRFRVMVDLLEMAVEIGKNQGKKVGFDLLGQADKFLMI